LDEVRAPPGRKHSASRQLQLGAGFRPPTDRFDRFSDEAPLRGAMPSRLGATDHLGRWRRGRAIVDGDVLTSQESRLRSRAIDVALLELDTGILGHPSGEGPPQPDASLVIS